MRNAYKIVRFTVLFITWASVLFIWGLAMFTSIPRVMGMEPYIVLSGSMEPTIPVGAVVYVQDFPEGDCPENGDIIAFEFEDGMEAIHRVIDYDPESGAYTTKGDMNETEDGTKVYDEEIIGKYAGHVPVIGYILANLDSHVFYVGQFKIPALVPILAGLIMILNVLKSVLGHAVENQGSKARLSTQKNNREEKIHVEKE